MKRSDNDKIVGGVFGGIGESTSIPAWLLRVVFIILLFGIGGITIGIGSGALILIYCLMWMFIPE
jgi:phage shock protein PspC (stress-responsive transcriptional regulator)